MGVGSQRHTPAALPPRKTRYPLYRSLGGPRGRSRQVRKTSPPPGFDPLTFQPVASRYNVWAIPALPFIHGICFMVSSGLPNSETCRADGSVLESERRAVCWVMACRGEGGAAAITWVIGGYFKGLNILCLFEAQQNFAHENWGRKLCCGMAAHCRKVWSSYKASVTVNLQEPCVLYIGRAYRYSPDVAFYIYFSTNISTEYFNHAAHSRFFSSKCRLFHNANIFGSSIIHILHTECAKI